MCEIKLYRIDNSNPAVKFEVVEKPNNWTKVIKQSELNNETEQRRYEYWMAFKDYANKNNQFSWLFKCRKPSTDSWMDFSIGKSGCHIAVSQIRKRNSLIVELYIRGNKELFNYLFTRKEEIENESALTFDWKELPEKKASRVIVENNVDFEDKNQWNNQFGWIIDMMLQMRNTFTKYIN